MWLDLEPHPLHTEGLHSEGREDKRVLEEDNEGVCACMHVCACVYVCLCGGGGA